MTKIQIISKMWSLVYDMLLYIKGHKTKSLDEIEFEMDVIEYHCRKYADVDDTGGLL